MQNGQTGEPELTATVANTSAVTIAAKPAQAANKAFAAGNALLISLRLEQRLPLALSVAAGVAATLLLILAWYAIALLVERSVLDKPFSWSLFTFSSPLTIGVLFALRACCLYLQERLAQRASLKIKQQLREKLLQQWQSMGLAQFQAAASQYASQWLEDVDALEGYFARYWPQQQLMLLSPLCILLAISWVNWLVGVLLLLSAPLIPLFMSLIGMGAEQINQRHLLQRQRLAGHFLDRLKKLVLINRLGATNQVAKEVAARSEHYRHLIMKTLKVAFLSSAVLEFFSSVAIAAVAIYIGFVLFGAIDFGPAAQLTLSTGLFMLALAPEFFQPLRQFAQSYHDKAAALAAANQLAQALAAQTTPKQNELAAKSEAHNDSEAAANPETRVKRKVAATQQSDIIWAAGYLNAVDLTVSTATDRLLISRLTFQLAPKQCLLIKGPSGVGKTTLLKTLAGLLPAKAGSLTLNDSAPALSRIFYMAQRPWIIHGSLRQNLQLLAATATDDELLAALAQVGLADLCQSAAQLDRALTERGEGLSGGQLQRLALARAFLQPYPFIMLDEPTASLDQASRQQVIAALKLLKQRTTLLMVSHDPALRALADYELNLTVADAPEQQQQSCIRLLQ